MQKHPRMLHPLLHQDLMYPFLRAGWVLMLGRHPNSALWLTSPWLQEEQGSCPSALGDHWAMQLSSSYKTRISHLGSNAEARAPGTPSKAQLGGPHFRKHREEDEEHPYIYLFIS